MAKHTNTIYMILNVIAAIAIGVLFWLLVTQQHRLDRANKNITIQRYETQLRDCFDLNRRHHDAIVAVLKNQNRSDADFDVDQKLILAIINAGIPHHNCQTYARVTTDSHP